ncbi:MAG: metalloregulator ArsR/SmtB family transcription factor [Rhodospirillaceae bacterium]|nr:metalloregulator ArsR/SmtB family transcription factor [Rhodospirillaceae bacterium]
MESYIAVGALGALAQEARLTIFRMLVQAGPGGLRVGAIGKALEIPPATLSFHLAQLQHAGLVTARRKGREMIQVAAFERMNELLAYLTKNCCGEDLQACAPIVCKPTPRRRKKP